MCEHSGTQQTGNQRENHADLNTQVGEDKQNTSGTHEHHHKRQEKNKEVGQ